MKYQILIAEDEKIERDYLQKLIEEKYASVLDVISVDNGEKAVEVFHEKQPDIVMADINMPIKNGLEALKEMRKNASKNFLSIILTSYDSFTYAQEGIRLGIEDYILKPAESSQICKTVSRSIEKIRQSDNFYGSVYALIEKRNQTKAIIDADCIDAIVNRNEENEILKYFKVKGIYPKSAVCLLAEDDGTVIRRLTEDLQDCGYMVISTEMADYYAVFLFATAMIQEEEEKNIHEMTELYLRTSKYSWGHVHNTIKDFYVSFEEASERFYEEKKRIADGSHSFIYRKAIAYMKENYKRPITLVDVGEKLEVTPQYISNVLSKEGSGKNFTTLLMEYRIDEAKRLISQHYSIKTVAVEVGFRSINYFSNCFKKYTGMTPRDYQKLFEI